jgi:hypothetical protein
MNSLLVAVSILLPTIASAKCPSLKGDFGGFCGGKYEKLAVELNGSCDTFIVNDKRYVIGKEVIKKSRPSLKKKRVDTYTTQITNTNDILAIKVDGTLVSDSKVGGGYTLNMTINYQYDYRYVDENTLQVARVITKTISSDDYCTFKRVTQ